MVDTVEFFNHVDVHFMLKKGPMGRFGDNEGFVMGMERLLHNVVKRLPEEEQFMPWTKSSHDTFAEFLVRGIGGLIGQTDSERI